MTVIIYDGKSIAADRQLTREDKISGEEVKINQWSKGYYSSSGRYDDAILFALWLEDRGFKFKPHKSFQGIYSEDSVVWEVLPELIPMPAAVPTGLGSGGPDAECLVRNGS